MLLCICLASQDVPNFHNEFHFEILAIAKNWCNLEKFEGSKHGPPLTVLEIGHALLHVLLDVNVMVKL
jgi:hypothetical protein